jgi:hypothetical protein
MTVSVILFKEFQKSPVPGSAFKFQLGNWTHTEGIQGVSFGLVRLAVHASAFNE